MMTKRIQKVSAAVLALGALGLGGSALAQGASTTEPVGGPDRDSIQAGDQTTPDTAAAAASATKASAPKASTGSSGAAAEQPGAESATEQPGAESATEQPGAEGSSETAADSDGPGGHADEPGNAAADNQFQGAQ
jgi:hypothetical protein